ncbi:MAG: prepilin peptidase [Candidatus Portnoybacteria bacterium]|nr:prepilin peptidase [Candidatus Portnoybacteria bacterium]MDD5589741.1 prepilin peptidase [Candidatus Portnoybacteria bacterium]
MIIEIFPFLSLVLLAGVSVGSFLNVLIIRLAAEKKITGRSRCPICGHVLGWGDLVPLLSFIWLKGKCRWCRKRISWQYPLVEAASGMIFLTIFIKYKELIFNLSAAEFAGAFFYAFIASCLVVVFVSDLKYFIIPDEIVLAGCVGAFFYDFILAWNFRILDLAESWKKTENWETLGVYMLCGFAAALFFMSIVILTKGKGMGLGDVKFVFLMGLVLGWPNILAGLLLAFAAGAIFGLILILFGRASMKSELPFGVFLAASTFFVMIFGNQFDIWLSPLL